MKISEALEIGEGSRVAVSGCGGKTSVINIIAREADENLSVLISPTTKICPARDARAPLLTDRAACLAHSPRRGVQCLGVLNSETGKLEALPPADLEEIAPRYDLVLMESDGSRGLPCKGWTERDPVVPDFSTHTIGVVSAGAIGLRANEENIFRLAEFLKLTGLEEGSRVTSEAVAMMASSPDGMFRRASGRIAVIINQADSAWGESLAESIAERMRALGGPFEKILAGSARENRWTEL
jgi:probable selenium-dependent hydroxylase accessory protein YqeC